MKNLLLLFIVTIISMIMFGCNVANDYVEEGDYCDSYDMQTVCDTDDYLLICEDGEYVATSCDTICGRSGLYSANDCSYDSVVDRDTCMCDGGNVNCIEGDTDCNGDGTISVCQYDSWVDVDCDDVCYDQGYDGYSGLCSYSSEMNHDVCWCEDYK
jgi:hypothetical protein